MHRFWDNAFKGQVYLVQSLNFHRPDAADSEAVGSDSQAWCASEPPGGLPKV